VTEAGPTSVLHDGERVTVRERTDALLVLEAEWAGLEARPPSHLHPHQDERFEVLEGELRVRLGAAERTLRAGDVLDIPRGTAHQMWNASERRARARWEVRPALRTQEFFAAVDRSRAFRSGKDGGMTPLGAGPVMAEFSDEFRLALPGPLDRPVVALLALGGRLRGYPRP
jgi:mannose-6-phosphate isomerase-like protein (cupin superfamily)